MPRQPMTYTVPQPLEPLNVEELKFWLHIMQEHAMFIKAGLPCGDTALIDEAQAFYQEFGALQQQAERIKTIKQSSEIVNEAYDAVKDFYLYKRELLQAKLACRLGGTNFPLFLDHLSREAEYFLRLLEKMRNGRVALKESSQTQETVFWLRIMADHAKFMSHLLDPSERSLIRMADEFSCEFDDLVLQGRDFASMIHNNECEVMAFRRFLLDVRMDVQRLRDFKKAAEDLIAECRLLGIMPETMADHIRREAEHFLMLLAMMERRIMKHTDFDFIEDIPCVDDEFIDSECCSADNFLNEDEEVCPPILGGVGLKKPKYIVPMEEGVAFAEPVLDNECGPCDDVVCDEPCEKAEVCCPELSFDDDQEAIEAEEEAEATKIIKMAKGYSEVKVPETKENAEDEIKVMAKASSYKTVPDKQELPNENTKKSDSKKPKYKWGGSFPRSLGKPRE
ncbi:DUF2935 domain-containing protein [Dendrosporobacter sp. 1207_IL3150]|uniref:DUF2935 domain-containing protein n=1 Tax=Dendrosporobacter sp. 1207_IL3150 TaxID=3084054 RepID=UPI002FDA06DC